MVHLPFSQFISIQSKQSNSPWIRLCDASYERSSF